MAIKSNLKVVANDGITKSRIITFVTDGASANVVDVGFEPNYVRVMNLTSGTDRYEWYRGFDATKTIKNGTGGFDTNSIITVAGNKVTVPAYTDTHVILLEVR